MSSVDRPSLTERFGMPALVAGIIAALVSTMIGGVLTGRIETSKQRLAILLQEKDQFDAAQNRIITELGLFTTRAFESNDVAKKEQLLSAIITAQLQLNRLQNDLHDPRDSKILLEYASELDKLSRDVRNASGIKDLGSILAATQRILALHDEVSEAVKQNVNVTIF
jgi:hypothetical protein